MPNTPADPVTVPLDRSGRAALLVDVAGLATHAEDADALDLARILAAVEARFTAVARIAYADWAPLAGLRRRAADLGFEQVQIAPADAGSGALAVRIAVDAMDIAIGTSEIGIVVFAGAGPALLPLIRTLRRKGRRVAVLVPARDRSSPLREHCDLFLVDGAAEPPSRAAATMTAGEGMHGQPAAIRPMLAVPPGQPASRPPAAPPAAPRLSAAPAAPAPRPSAPLRPVARAEPPRLTRPEPEPRPPGRPPLVADPPPGRRGR